MAIIRYRAKVRKNGSLTIPKQAQEQLGVQPGDAIEVSLSRSTGPFQGDRSENPLAQIAGIGKKGLADGAVKHDTYLYSKRSA